MTKELTASKRVNAHINFRRSQPIDALVCLVLTLGMLAILVKPLGDCGMGQWYWGAFCVINLIYDIHGLKTKAWDYGLASGAMIMLGPISFYFWTMLGAWRKYVVYKKGGYGWTIQKLEEKLTKHDLSEGFDFDFSPKHRRKVESLLKACKLTYEQILDEDWARATGYQYDLCMSITDTPENMEMREALR